MNHQETLKSLEDLLESFLERVVALKEERLEVLEGINRLDDIARRAGSGDDMTDEIGDWFADHNRWLTDSSLKPADVRRISDILGEFGKQVRVSEESSPAQDKIHREIDRWNETTEKLGQKLILKRGPETAPAAMPQEDTIAQFDRKLDQLVAVFKDHTHGKQHILSVADDLLKSARVQGNKDALILSALVIYYLRQIGYKVEPYVRKLREAETLIRKGSSDA